MSERNTQDARTRRALRIALDAMVRSFGGNDCDCAYSPHFKSCKRMALVEELRAMAGLPRWPGYAGSMPTWWLGANRRSGGEG